MPGAPLTDPGVQYSRTGLFNPTRTEPRSVRLWTVGRGLRAWHAPQQQHGTRETLKGPAALITSAKRVGEFNDKMNAPKPARESDSSIVANGKTPVSKRVKGRTG